MYILLIEWNTDDHGKQEEAHVCPSMDIVGATLADFDNYDPNREIRLFEVSREISLSEEVSEEARPPIKIKQAVCTEWREVEVPQPPRKTVKYKVNEDL